MPVTSNALLPYGANSLTRNDDGSSSRIDLTPVFGSGLNFDGTVYRSLFVNTNGNVTFDSSLSQYTPGRIGTQTSAIIAPFWADVDTRESTPGSNGLVFYDYNTARDSFVITWAYVGYFSVRTDKLNTFQLELKDIGGGNFDIIFRYQDINWTTGSASGGSNGFGGTPARAGFNSGDGLYFELPGSGDEAQVLYWDTAAGNLGISGVWEFQVVAGNFSNFGTDNGEVYSGLGGDDYYFAQGGADVIYGFNGSDRLYAGDGNDYMDGGDGNDFCDGGAGDDAIIGGQGNDQASGGDGNDVILLDDFSNPGGPGGNDTGFGGDGNDLLWGYAGFDTLYGGDGNDALVGNDFATYADGVDQLYGGNGQDILFVGLFGSALMDGGAGNDQLYGAGGADTLIGGGGSDFMFGAGGADTFMFRIEDLDFSTDQIYFFNPFEGDRVVFDATLAGRFTMSDVVYNVGGTNVQGVYVTDDFGWSLAVYGTSVASLQASTVYFG